MRVISFEGEQRGPGERRRADPPRRCRAVAAFDYAASVAHQPSARPPPPRRRPNAAALPATWQAEATAASCGWRGATADAARSGPARSETLLDLFLIGRQPQVATRRRTADRIGLPLRGLAALTGTGRQADDRDRPRRARRRHGDPLRRARPATATSCAPSSQHHAGDGPREERRAVSRRLDGASRGHSSPAAFPDAAALRAPHRLAGRPVQETQDPVPSAYCSARVRHAPAGRGTAAEIGRCSARSPSTVEGVRRRALRRLGAECPARLGGRRLQRLGRPPPPDAATRRSGRVGALRAAAPRRRALQVRAVRRRRRRCCR